MFTCESGAATCDFGAVSGRRKFDFSPFHIRFFDRNQPFPPQLHCTKLEKHAIIVKNAPFKVAVLLSGCIGNVWKVGSGAEIKLNNFISEMGLCCVGLGVVKL